MPSGPLLFLSAVLAQLAVTVVIGVAVGSLSSPDSRLFGFTYGAAGMLALVSASFAWCATLRGGVSGFVLLQSLALIGIALILSAAMAKLPHTGTGSYVAPADIETHDLVRLLAITVPTLLILLIRRLLARRKTDHGQ